MPPAVIVIPEWAASQLSLEELGMYVALAREYNYQEIQPNPQELARKLHIPLPKIKELLNSLVAKQILVKGAKAYRLEFGTITSQATKPQAKEATSTASDAATTLVANMSTKMPELEKVLGKDLSSLVPLVDEALRRGVTPSQIFQAIGSRTLRDVENPIGALTYRLRGISPAQERSEREPCPLHRGHYWSACPCCKGEIKEGVDPYRGREASRPRGWLSAYPEGYALIDEVAEKAAQKAREREE